MGRRRHGRARRPQGRPLSGGLTLGGGLIAGGVLGALGSAGLARCVNLVRGTERSFVTWNAAALDATVEAALLRLLAVEHFGRGRGDWVEGEAPPPGPASSARRWRRCARRSTRPGRSARPGRRPTPRALARAARADRRAERRERRCNDLYPDAGRVWPAEPAEERSDEPTHP